MHAARSKSYLIHIFFEDRKIVVEFLKHLSARKNPGLCLVRVCARAGEFAPMCKRNADVDANTR